MLGLKAETDSGWAEAAVRDLDRVLADHAHCEMKAASNALSLATRHPDRLDLVRALTDLAREEIEHFQRVLSALEARGVALGPPPVDEYASRLRTAAHHAGGPRLGALVDRLLIGALIEARSCERFKLLAGALEAHGERALHAFYTELLAAEARHYRQFIDLAVNAAEGAREAVLARLDALAEREAIIVRDLAAAADRATIHG
jgi:tRNA-(ms[2]io[6]A)-hydroxylase